MFCLSKIFLIYIALACFSLHVEANPVTYTISGKGSGTIGTASFSNTNFTFILNGDTTGVGMSYGIPISSAGIAEFTLDGVGSGTTSINTVVSVYSFSSTTYLIGFTDTGFGSGFEGSATSNSPVTLTDTQGPTPFDFIYAADLPTTLGDFNLSSASDLTYSAQVAAVPEASSITSFSIGLAFLMIIALATHYRVRKKTEFS